MQGGQEGSQVAGTYVGALPPGITPASAFHWFADQWAVTAGKWAVPVQGQATFQHAGQVAGSGFVVGAAFEVVYTQTVHSSTGMGKNRSSITRNETVTNKYDVAVVDRTQNLLKLLVHPEVKTGKNQPTRINIGTTPQTQTFGTLHFTPGQFRFHVEMFNLQTQEQAREQAGCCLSCCLRCCCSMAPQNPGSCSPAWQCLQ